MEHIPTIALVVRDYDEAIDFYTKTMLFDLVEDTDRGHGKRWVLVRPRGGQGAKMLLAKAKNDRQTAAIGNQTGGRVAFFLYTDDFDGYYAHLVENGVQVVRSVSVEDFGKVCVIADLYGNLWDLIEPEND